MFRRGTSSRRGHNDHGFTLIELLVVITILGILAAIVVFAVKGIDDKGKNASIATDAKVLSTAEEAHCAQHGSYTNVDGLKSTRLLASDPSYNGVVVTSGNCGGTGFIVGSTQSAPTGGALVLGASNVTPPFSFLATTAPKPVTFSFDSSKNLASKANAGTGILFASADEANVNATISTGDTLPSGTADRGSSGSCTTTCKGIGSTKRLYAVGRLAAESCTASGKTLAPAANAPLCKQPSQGYRGALGALSDLKAALLTTCTSCKLAIPDPGSAVKVTGSIGADVGSTNATCTPDQSGGVAAPSSPPTAPYGVAAYQALTTPTSLGGAGMTCNEYAYLVCTGRIIGPGYSDQASPAAPTGCTQAASGNNVTTTQTKLVGGTAEYGLIPNSFVTSPSGADTNNVFHVPATAHSPINQYAVVLNNGSTDERNAAVGFLNYVCSSTGQTVLAAFGYDALPSGACATVPSIP